MREREKVREMMSPIITALEEAQGEQRMGGIGCSRVRLSAFLDSVGWNMCERSEELSLAQRIKVGV